MVQHFNFQARGPFTQYTVIFPLKTIYGNMGMSEIETVLTIEIFMKGCEVIGMTKKSRFLFIDYKNITLIKNVQVHKEVYLCNIPTFFPLENECIALRNMCNVLTKE